MTAVDVDLDLETLYDQEPFEVFLTPLRSTMVVFPEKVASIESHHGRTVASACWEVPGDAFVDGVRARVGERTASIACEPTAAQGGRLIVLVPVEELP